MPDAARPADSAAAPGRGDLGARQDVLSRKADAARRAFEARAMSPAKALRRALSRTADVLWDLALVTRAVDQEPLDQDGVVAQLHGDALLVLLDGPEGAVGLVSVARELVTGLTEVQTMLQVTQMPAEPRRYTVTDAAMTAPLIDGVLERFPRFLEDHPLRAQLEGFRFGAMLEDARAAGMLLDAPAYTGFRAEVDLALGRRTGDLRLFLPERLGAERSDGAGVGGHERNMGLLPAQLRAVLGSLRLPLRDAQALRPGDLLPLEPRMLETVTLYAGTGLAATKPVAGGRLGQMNGMRAVRLTWPQGAAAAQDGQRAAGAAPQPSPAAAFAAAADPAPLADAGLDDAAGSEALGTAEFGLDEIAADLPDLSGFPGLDGEASDDAAGGEFDFDFSVNPMPSEE